MKTGKPHAGYCAAFESTAMTTPDQAIEAQIQAAGADKAPRITPTAIEVNIVSEHYFTALDGATATSEDIVSVWHDDKDCGAERVPLSLLTFCVLVLKNGFTVTGESACASPENFNAEIGRKIARENAVAKVWPLMGYELRSSLSQSKQSK